NPVQGRWPSWFSNGSGFAYSRNGQIWIANGAGTQLALFGPGFSGQQPAWGPGGRWVAYVTDAHQLAMVKIFGTFDHPLTTGPAVDHAPAWSPDSHWIAYLSTNAAGRTSIRMLHPTPHSSDHRRIVTDITTSAPIWSPDGRDLAFWSDRHGSGIYL